MNKELKIILVKFALIVAGMITYILVMMFYVAPMVVEQAYGQSAFDTPNQFSQPYDQFNQQQPQYNNQYQYQQPYQQFGTPTYQPYQQYDPYQQPMQYGNNQGINIQQLIGYILSAAGGVAGGKVVSDRKIKSLKEEHEAVIKDTMHAELKTKEQLAELARVSYQMNPEKANAINDAPTVKLETLSKDVDEFREKAAKA